MGLLATVGYFPAAGYLSGMTQARIAVGEYAHLWESSVRRGAGGWAAGMMPRSYAVAVFDHGANRAECMLVRCVQEFARFPELPEDIEIKLVMVLTDVDDPLNGVKFYINHENQYPPLPPSSKVLISEGHSSQGVWPVRRFRFRDHAAHLPCSAICDKATRESSGWDGKAQLPVQ